MNFYFKIRSNLWLFIICIEVSRAFYHYFKKNTATILWSGSKSDIIEDCDTFHNSDNLLLDYGTIYKRNSVLCLK